MTHEEMLAALKEITGETDAACVVQPACDGCNACPGAQPISTRAFTDAQLTAILELSGWNLMRAAYRALIAKAEASNVTLASGVSLPDNSAHWLRLAKLYKPNTGRALLRADDPKEGGDVD